MTKTLFASLLMIASIAATSSLSFADSAPKDGIAALKTELEKLGAPKVDGKSVVGKANVDALYFGTTRINLNYKIVDEIQTKHGCTATVFVKDGAEFVRVSTNVKKDNLRIIGTPLAHNKAYDAITKGESFCGDVEIAGSPYNTCYEPIKAAGATLGIYYFGCKK